MTTGQRIAQKRKESGLSQEALGEEVGVSRQSIYKWESDAALPEIDKLVALSRRFGVTVGWLLGVEEAPEAPPAPASRERRTAENGRGDHRAVHRCPDRPQAPKEMALCTGSADGAVCRPPRLSEH